MTNMIKYRGAIIKRRDSTKVCKLTVDVFVNNRCKVDVMMPTLNGGIIRLPS